MPLRSTISSVSFWHGFERRRNGRGGAADSRMKLSILRKPDKDCFVKRISVFCSVVWASSRSKSMYSGRETRSKITWDPDAAVLWPAMAVMVIISSARVSG